MSTYKQLADGSEAIQTEISSVAAGVSVPVTQEFAKSSGSTSNIVASITVTGMSAYGFPYESVTFTRAGSTGNVGLVYGRNTSGVFMFNLSWSSGNDAVNITATGANGDDFGNIPHNIAGTVSVAEITADSTGTLYIG